MNRMDILAPHKALPEMCNPSLKCGSLMIDGSQLQPMNRVWFRKESVARMIPDPLGSISWMGPEPSWELRQSLRMHLAVFVSPGLLALWHPGAGGEVAQLWSLCDTAWTTEIHHNSQGILTESSSNLITQSFCDVIESSNLLKDDNRKPTGNRCKLCRYRCDHWGFILARVTNPDRLDTQSLGPCPTTSDQ